MAITLLGGCHPAREMLGRARARCATGIGSIEVVRMRELARRLESRLVHVECQLGRPQRVRTVSPDGALF